MVASACKIEAKVPENSRTKVLPSVTILKSGVISACKIEAKPPENFRATDLLFAS